MILLYGASGRDKGLSVLDSKGSMFIKAMISVSGSDRVVLITDNETNSTFIEKIIDTNMSPPYVSTNFSRIKDDEEWNSYHEFFKAHEFC